MPRRTKKPAAPGGPAALPDFARDFGVLQLTAGAQIVKVRGVTGIFTPVTNRPDKPLTDDERKNFQALIEQLTRQVAALQASNLALTKQLDDLRNPPHSADAFSTAIQYSVDDLQQKLTTMKNPMSNFGLKGFRIDARVMIDISRLGAIEYRFIRPGDPADPNAVSQITMDLVPIPKAGADHTWTPDLFQPDLSIEALPQITRGQAKVLEASHIFTIGEFLQVGTRARATAELVALLRIERTALADWVRQAELLTIKGTNGATVLVLIAAGYPSLDAIAHSTPDALLAAHPPLAKTLTLVRARADLIRSRKPKVSKNSTGYNLFGLVDGLDQGIASLHRSKNPAVRST